MGLIFCILGKSSTGKDSIFRELISDEDLNLRKIVTYTTRPMREGEKNGREYFFVSKEVMDVYQNEGKIIESRSYQTVKGEWYYFTVDNIEEDNRYNYIVIGTIDMYDSLKTYYGTERVVPIYIEVDDVMRLKRALAREEKEKVPQIKEMCRRFLADTEDYAEEKINGLGITVRFTNDVFDDTYVKIKKYIQETLKREDQT